MQVDTSTNWFMPMFRLEWPRRGQAHCMWRPKFIGSRRYEFLWLGPHHQKLILPDVTSKLRCRETKKDENTFSPCLLRVLRPFYKMSLVDSCSFNGWYWGIVRWKHTLSCCVTIPSIAVSWNPRLEIVLKALAEVSGSINCGGCNKRVFMAQQK